MCTIEPDRSVYDALTLMAERNIGSLAVMEEGRLVGMFSERDYARNIILKDRELSDASRESAERIRDAAETSVAALYAAFAADRN